MAASALGRTRSVALQGLVGAVVDVEAQLGNGLPAFLVGGLPDAAVSQSTERVKAAALSVGAQVGQSRITVNLSPASIPKQGTGFDLPIAVAVLAAHAKLPAEAVEPVCHFGEIGLDGSVRPVHGVLPSVLAAHRHGVRVVVVAAANAAEAALVDGVEVRPVRSLADLVRGYELLAAGRRWPEVPTEPRAPGEVPSTIDLSDVAGQDSARSALELAAAGGHHLLLHGPPGAGKTMLAERLVTILPPLTRRQALEVLAIRSLTGAPGEVRALPTRPPFVAPHHSATTAALVGGGTTAIRPGDISRAHHGVLLLDEAPEFRSSVLQSLRQPLESGEVHIGRALTQVTYPARFQLVLAANPCPCGNAYGRAARCQCSALTVRRYAAKLTGPLVDRVDLHVLVPPAGRQALGALAGETSAVVAARVADARATQAARWAPLGFELNSLVPGSALRRPPWRLPGSVTVDLDRSIDRGAITLRGYDRVLRVAWTAADVGGRARPGRDDVGFALGLRQAAAA